MNTSQKEAETTLTGNYVFDNTDKRAKARYRQLSALYDTRTIVCHERERPKG